MNLLRIILAVTALLTVVVIHEDRAFPQSGESRETSKELTINWDPVDGAVKYQVQVKDSVNTVILDRIVDSSEVRFTVPMGEYRMRVGAINLFDKIGAWSEWSELKIMRREAPEAMRFRGIIDHGFTVAAGFTYFQVLSQLDEMYDSSQSGWTLVAGYRFRSLPALSGIGFVKNLGLEFELSNISFKGNTLDSVRDNSLEILSAGGNLKYTTAFNFPLNLSIRAGIGAAYTDQQYRVPQSGGSVFYDVFRISSTDPYYKGGISLVFDFYHSFFLETGVEYFMVDYIGNDLTGARYLFLAGMKI